MGLVNHLVTPFSVSFILTAALTPVLILVAWRVGWIDQPREHRWHRRPTALMGGIPIAIGTVAAWLTLHGNPASFSLLIASVALFTLGVIDDRLFELLPRHKLLGQVGVAIGWLCLTGLPQGVPPALVIPIALLWLVGVTNAVNLLDNMDGLAAGIVAIASSFLAAHCALHGQPHVATLAVGLAGACAAFLLYNFNPARVFMGDCGSMFLGFSLAALCLEATLPSLPSLPALPSIPWTLGMPIALVGVPLLDTGLVVFARARNGRPILPGYRDHSSHRLVAGGLNERRTALVHYAFALAFGCVVLSAPRFPIFAALLGITIGISALMLGRRLLAQPVYPAPSPTSAKVKKFGLRSLTRFPALYAVFDLGVAGLAFYGAHALRFEGTVPATFQREIWAVIPVVALCKLLGMGFAEAYRPSNQRAAVRPGFTAIIGAAAGSLLSTPLIAGLFGFDNLSRAALLIDFLLFAGLMLWIRSGRRLADHFRAVFMPTQGPRVLILGAGAEAFVICTQLGESAAKERADVLGILAHDPLPTATDVAGVPVIGGVNDLNALLPSLEVDRFLLGVYPESPEGRQIARLCDRLGVELCSDLDEAWDAPDSAAARGR